MSFARFLAAAKSEPGDVDRLDDLARAALGEGEEEAALEVLVSAAEKSNSALLWQWVGLLQRSLDEHPHALSSFARAAGLAPADANIAHGYARTALEAGLDAIELFETARSLAPDDGWIILGLAAAKSAAGRGELAADELGAVLEQSPGWIDGHEQFAQLVSTLGQRDRATETLDIALKRFPRRPELWRALFAIDLRRQDYRALDRDLARAAQQGLPSSSMADYRAIVAAELATERLPPALFSAAPTDMPSLQLWRIRHLLRVGSADAALPLIDAQLASERAADIWPYAATAWRLTGSDRSNWLEGDPAFVRVIDVRTHLPPLAELAGTLRALHVARGEFLDQSVRGGTQTDGPLLSRIDPSIRILRSAIVRAVEDYVSYLPVADPRHPLLAPRRDRRIRFSGSWSVRLRSGGRHSNHVHPQGWISSALYIALPERTHTDAQDAGWFTLGEPDSELGLDLPPRCKVEPRQAHLVLFPSWMWHGTVPFGGGERLTVAFDVRPPI